MAKKHHVLLISDQLIPNYLPTVDENLKPDVVTFVVSGKMEATAQRLRKIFKENQIAVTEDIKLTDAFDIAKIQKQMENWINENDNGDEIILNATGGNKPMAIAAQEVFRMMGKEVFYVDINADRVEWINKMDGPSHREAIYLKQPIKLKRYFELVNTEVCDAKENNRAISEDWKRFATQAMVDNIENFESSLGILNKLANDAEKYKTLDLNELANKAEKADTLDQTKVPLWKNLNGDLLSELQGSGLITLIDDSCKFVNAEARAFCNGLWLEEMVFSLLKDKYGLTKHQCLANVKVNKLDLKQKLSKKREERNEIDIAVVSKNSLYVIECKTRNMRQNKNENVVSEAIYKLSYLQNTCGLRSRGIIVSARPVSKNDKERAEDVGIKIFDNLKTLAEDLKKKLQLTEIKG